MSQLIATIPTTYCETVSYFRNAERVKKPNITVNILHNKFSNIFHGTWSGQHSFLGGLVIRRGVSLRRPESGDFIKRYNIVNIAVKIASPKAGRQRALSCKIVWLSNIIGYVDSVQC